MNNGELDLSKILLFFMTEEGYGLHSLQSPPPPILRVPSSSCNDAVMVLALKKRPDNVTLPEIPCGTKFLRFFSRSAKISSHKIKLPKFFYSAKIYSTVEIIYTKNWFEGENAVLDSSVDNTWYPSYCRSTVV